MTNHTIELLKMNNSISAKINIFYWRVVRRYAYEICHRCGKPVMRTTNSWWSAPDDLWEKNHKKFNILCPPCFHDLANENGDLIFFVAEKYK